MTNTDDGAERIAREILGRHARAPTDSLESGTRLSEVVTSLQLIVVILELERALGRRPFDVTKVGSLVTVGDFLAAVARGEGR